VGAIVSLPSITPCTFLQAGSGELIQRPLRRLQAQGFDPCFLAATVLILFEALANGRAGFGKAQQTFGLNPFAADQVVAEFALDDLGEARFVEGKGGGIELRDRAGRAAPGRAGRH
jgi:hypothetical protein